MYLLSSLCGNKNVSSVETGCWFDITEKQVKEFLLFVDPVTSTLFYFTFLFTQFEGNNKTGKTKATALSNHVYDTSKNIFCFSVTVSLSPTQFYILPLKLPTPN